MEPRINGWLGRVVEMLRNFFHSASGESVHELSFAYQKAGLTVRDEPIPWNAETVLLEAVIPVPTGATGRSEEFSLQAADGLPWARVLCEPAGAEKCRVHFRAPLQKASGWLRLCWRDRVLVEARLPRLSRDQFVRGLRLRTPTILACLGKEHVPCQAAPEGQCAGLLARGQLVSSTSLLPLLDLPLAVAFTSPKGRTERCEYTPVAARLHGREVLCTLASPGSLDGLGRWTVRWEVAGRHLARGSFRLVTARALRRYVRLAGTEYAYGLPGGDRGHSRGVPLAETALGLAPSFRLVSGWPGLAGLCRVAIRAWRTGATQAQTLREHDVLVSDIPSAVEPPLLSWEEFRRFETFELTCEGRSLGSVPGGARYMVRFTNEGGCALPADWGHLPWSERDEQRLVQFLSHSEEKANPSCDRATPGEATGLIPPTCGEAGPSFA